MKLRMPGSKSIISLVKDAWRQLKSKLIKNKTRWLCLLGLSVILLLSFKIAQARSLSFHFVDEEEHITSGHLINQGYKLHRDIQGNHQPLVYFGSVLTQRLTQPDNIFMLIRRHRQAMFVYGAVWSFILVWRFKSLGLVFVLFFEFLKYFLFGNMNLMEAQAVYPGVYLLAVMLESWFNKFIPSRKELMFLGICTFLVIFNMVPLWPWLVLVWLVLWLKTGKLFKWQIGGLLVSTAILFSLNYSPVDWFRETVWNNFLYAVPQLSPFQTIWDWLKMIFFPFLAFFTKNSLQANFIAMFFTGWLATLGYLVYKKDKKALPLGLLYFFLMLANNRVLSPGSVYYHGFHLLPWLGLMIWVFGFSLKLLIKKYPKLKLKVLVIFAVWGLILIGNESMPYFLLKTDIEHEYYVNYSTLDDFNFAIKTIVAPVDRLAVTANEPILYWNTGAKLATRQVIYGGWEPSVKELNENYQRVFLGDDPPEIIYGNDEPKLLEEKYVNIMRYDKTTKLFVRKDKFEEITDEEWQALESRGFENFYENR